MPGPNLSALNRTADQVKRPVALNDGTYFAVVREPRVGESDKKKTPYVEYTIELSHAHEDTDLDGVDDKGTPVRIDPKGKKMRFSFWFTEESEYRFLDFIKSVGVNPEGRSFKELIPQAVGQQVQIEVSKQPNKTQDGYFNEVKSMKGMVEEAPTEQQQIDEAQGKGRRRAG